MEFSIGTEVGAYKILSPLGAGLMGEVYRALDLSMSRVVAVKVLPETISSNVESVFQLRNEATRAAELIHPNIAATYDLSELSEHTFLVQEYVGGETLAERLQRGPLSIDETLHIALQIVKGLEVAHRRDIIHCGLRPQNIMITANGDVKVLDFALGLFRQRSRLPEMTSPFRLNVANLCYMSPEQALGKKVDTATDVWALGCLVYEMLSGRRAFNGHTPDEIVEGIVRGIPDWQALPRGVTPKALSFLQKSLQKDPGQRIAFFRGIDSYISGFTETKESSTYVNFWFPDLLTIEDKWTVGEAVRLIVNIGPKSDSETAATASDQVSIDKEHLLYSLDHVDVIVMCPGAKVQPISKQINLPPGPNARAEFLVTPKDVGAYEITVILIVKGDPIHRSFFKFEAIKR